MPQFPQLTRRQSDQIYTYIRAGARDELARQAAEMAGTPGEFEKLTKEKGRVGSF
jgi:hypothetical protein